MTALANRNGMRTSIAAACAAFPRRKRVARLRSTEPPFHGRHASVPFDAGDRDKPEPMNLTPAAIVCGCMVPRLTQKL